MDRITLEELKATFGERHEAWCVSLYMPTHRAGRDMEQDPIRCRNLLRRVEERLLSKGLRTPEVQELLKKPQRVLQDQAFWQRQSDGLAVFFSARAEHYFRVPLTFPELVVTARRFHVKPLLPLLTGDGLFHILALSQNQVRLLEGTRQTVDEVDLQGIAQSLGEAFPEAAADKQLQFHTGTPSGSGRRAAIFHGQDFSDDTKDKILRWFRLIDRKVNDLLADGRSPLVLAGVDYLFPLYRDVNTYARLLDQGVAGNPEGLKPEELQQRAWRLVGPVFKEARGEAAARYRQLAGTGQTTTDVKEAVLAARHGRVEVLFTAIGLQVWGHFDPAQDQLQVHQSPEPGDEDLLDLAAIETLIKGGTVYAVAPDEVREFSPLAAIFRY